MSATKRGVTVEPTSPEPTTARAGSEEKIKVLCERRARGQPLFHPRDNPLIDHLPSALQGGGLATLSHRVTGVRRHGNRWRARIKCVKTGKTISLGVYDTEEEATRAVLEGHKKLGQ